MINWALRQSQQVEKERRRFIEETSLEQAHTKTKRKAYPVGSMFFWALGAVYGPEGSADSIEAAE